MRIIIAAALCVSVVVQCLAQDIEDNVPPSGAVVIKRPEITSQPSEEDFSALLADKPEVPITSPQTPPKPVEPKLPAERSMVINRPCRLERDKAAGGWAVLKFLHEDGKPDEMNRYVLPNQRLEEMEAAIAKDPETTFLVSGECTVYRQRPFLIVRLALTQAKGAPRPEVLKPLPAPKSGPAAPVSTRNADRLIEELLAKRPGKPMLVNPESSAEVDPVESVSPAVARQLPQAFGMMVADRVVYLSIDPKSGWATVRFIADNTVQEQPIRLLPNQLALQARDFSKTKTGRAVRLRVSGELTRYKGNQYLLLRKVLRERQMNQF